MAGVAPVMLPNPATGSDPSAVGTIPFRQATTERAQTLISETAIALTAGTQLFERQIEGSGFVYGVVLRASATAAANALAVSFAEDAPFNVFDSVNFHDVNGQIIELSGFGLMIANLMNGDYRFRDPTQAPNPQIFQAISGGAANAGSFAVTLRVPIALNRRDILAALGNQDRSQIYQLRSPLAASTAIYTTAPTSLPAVTIERVYESYSVPLPVAPNGQPQMQVPPMYGSIRSITRTLSEAVPAPGTINHFLRRIGSTIRGVAIVLRSNGSRLTADTLANQPTLIRLLVGDEPIFNETAWYRQLRNFEAYGNRMPAGVFIYQNMGDFMPGAGYEQGHDWYHSQQVQSLQFQISYPAGFGSTNNSLEFITDDIVLRQPVTVRQ